MACLYHQSWTAFSSNNFLQRKSGSPRTGRSILQMEQKRLEDPIPNREAILNPPTFPTAPPISTGLLIAILGTSASQSPLCDSTCRIRYVARRSLDAILDDGGGSTASAVVFDGGGRAHVLCPHGKRKSHLLRRNSSADVIGWHHCSVVLDANGSSGDNRRTRSCEFPERDGQ